MARVCELTGKKPLTGNKVSHSNRKSRTRWLPNLKKKKYTIPELKLTTTMYLSANAIKTIDKLGGITNALMKAKDKTLSENLLIIKNKVKKAKSGSKAAKMATATNADAPAKAAMPAKKAAKPAKSTTAKA